VSIDSPFTASDIADPRAQPTGITVTPSAAALGAIITCSDLRRADRAMLDAVRQASLDHLVVVIRSGQALTDGDLVEFGRHFGEYDISSQGPESPLVAMGKATQGGKFAEFPEITVVSNVVENGVALGGLGDGELVWHTDRSSHRAPPAESMLCALEIPPVGGETAFCNMYLALDALTHDLRQRIDGLRLKHDSTTDSAGKVRAKLIQYEGASVRDVPGGVHPLICTHPDTQCDYLYLGRRPKSYLMGLEVAESEALLDALWEHATQPAFTWMHEWQVGDVVIWDNRCTLHRREAFDPNSRRIMHRVMIQGAAPSRAPGRHAPHRRGAGFLAAPLN
jgi:taurine dioxygenase